MTDSVPEEQNVEELKREKPDMTELVEEQCIDHDGEKIKEEECERPQNVKISSNKSFHSQEFMSALTKEKDEETIEKSSYMALDVKSFNTLGPNEEQGKAVEDGSSATTGTTEIEELWGKEQPNDDNKELSTSRNAEASNLWHDELKVKNTKESVSSINREKNVEPNATRQNTDEILNKEEKLNDELETAPQIEATESSLQEEEFKDEKSEATFDHKTDVKNPEGIKIKDERTDKGTADASSATQLSAEEGTEQIDEAPTAQDEVQCIEEVFGDDEVDTQLPMQDMPEVSEADAEDNLVEGEPQSGTHNDELERVHEDKDTMTTVQTKSSDGESNYIFSSLQLAEPSENKKAQALLDENITQDNASMEVEREGRLEEPLDAVYQNIEAREEIDNPEKENTCQEKSTVNVEEKFEEDEMDDGFVHKYQDLTNETVPANIEDANTEEDVGDLPGAQESSEETIPKGEMQESGITSSNQDLSRDVGDNLHQQIYESEPEYFMNNSELISKGPSSITVAEAEVANTDTLGTSVKVHTTVNSPSISQPTIREDIEEAMGHKEPIEERVEVVENDEDHYRHTFEAIIEVVGENMIHEDSTKFEDTNPEDEENDKNTVGVSSMEQLEGEKLSEGNELEKEKDCRVLAVDSHICLEESKTEETPYCILDKEKHETENDPNLVFETIIMAKHSVVTGDNEDEHLEKQEYIKDNYNPHDELKETAKKDEDLQDTVGQKHEDLNYPHEQEILETANAEDNIVDDGGHTSQTAEMFLESGPEQKSQDQMDEMETTRIDESTFDDNLSNMNATNELCEETAKRNEMIANTNENKFVEATIQEKVHEDPTDSICKEKNQNTTNDIDMVQEEMESENSEKDSQLASEEHQHNKLSGSEAAYIDPSAGDNSTHKVFGDLCTLQASKEVTHKENDPEDTNEDMSALNNDYEGHKTNAGVAEVVVEKEIHQRTEEQRCKQDETAAGMTLLHDDKIQREKTHTRSELESSEFPTISVDPEIRFDETTTDEASLEVVGSEDKIGNPSDVVSDKTILDETSVSTQDVEEMDLLEKQKESFLEKTEVIMLPTFGSEDKIINPSDVVSETIMAETSTSTQAVEKMDLLEKQEESSHEKAEVSMLQIVGSEDKVGNPSDVVSEKTIMVETIASNQDAEEMDLLGKQEESFQEKTEVAMLLECAVARMGTDNPSYKADGASMEDLTDETVPANREDDNTEENVDDLPVAQESSEKAIPKGEMQESSITSTSQDLNHDAGDNLHQQTCESQPENLMNNSELISEGPGSKTVAEAEVTNTDPFRSDVKVHTTVSSPSISQATNREDVEEAMGHKEPIEESVEVVDNNEDHDRHTFEAIIEVVGENMIHEDSKIFDETNPEDGENDKNTAGVSSMEQLEGEEVSEGNEPEKEKDSRVLAVDSYICREESKTEEIPYCILDKEKHETENDPILVFETIIKAKHSVVTGDNEDEPLEKQEYVKDNYNPHDKLIETVKKDEDLQDTVGQKHEEDLNYPHEGELFETANAEDDIVDDRVRTTQTAEMVLESGPEQKSQDQMDEMKTTRIDKSTFDDNFSNMNATNELREETAMPNEMIANTNENEYVEATIQEKVHEDPNDSTCKGKHQNMTNDIDMIQEEMKTENSEKASQLVFEEHQQDKISGSEAACVDPSTGDNSTDKAFGDLCTSQASEEENTQKATQSEEANEDISALNNDYESHDKNAGVAEVVVEKEIHQRTEVQRCKEDETAEGMSLLHDDKIQKEKTDPRSELEASESPTISVDLEICLDETTIDKAPLEVVGSEDKIGKPSDVVSEKNVDENISTQDVEEMDLLEKQIESFQEKAEVIMLPTVGSEDKTTNPSDAVSEIIMAETSTSTQDVEEIDLLEKQEESFHEKNEVSMLKIVGSEDKVENPSDVVSEETIMAETIASNQDAKEMDFFGKQEESFKEKGEVTMLLEHAIARMGTGNPSYKEDDATLEYINDEEGENQEESLKDLNSTYAEQTYGTINISNKNERELSQKLEFVSKSAEDEDQGINKGKEASKMKNSLADGSLKRTIPETLEPSNLNENVTDETTQDKHNGKNHDRCLLVEEIVHGAITGKHTEDQSSACEEQTYQSTNLEGIIQGDVNEDEKDTVKLGIPSGSLIEIKGQEDIGESAFTEMNVSIDNENSKMIHGVAEQVKDEENLSKAIEESQTPDSHALVLPRPYESNDEKYEESSKSVFEEQCHQTTTVGEKTEASVHKERTVSESLQIIEEKVEIPEIVVHSADSQTVKGKGEDTLEEDIGNIPNTGELLQKTTYNGVGEDHEYDNNITSTEDTIITDIDKEIEKNYQLDTEYENSEKASRLVSEEHQHNKISGLEAAYIDPLAGDNSTNKAFGDLCTSQAPEEEYTQKATNPEKANEDISALKNDYEGHDKNAGVAEVVVEKEIHQSIEEQRCKEDETAAGMSLLHDDKIQREQTDTKSELELSESPTISVDPEICLNESTIDQASREVVGSEDTIGNPSDVVSEKTIRDETSISTQDVEKMDLLEKQKESFQEKAEVIMLPIIGSEDKIRNPSDVVSETIMAETSTSTQDVEKMDLWEKQEESFHEKAEVSMLQIVGSEDKVENPSDVVSEKTIMAETIASNEDAKEIDLLGKQEESFQEKAEVTMLLEHAVAKMGTDNPSYKADGASLEYINDAEGEKQEESLKDLNCKCAEQTYGTINISNKIEREPSQKLEFISKSAPEDKDQGTNMEEEACKIKNSLDDGSLERTIPETIEQCDFNENAKGETTQGKHIGNNHDSHLLVEEVVQTTINGNQTEGQSSAYEEQTYQTTNLEGIIQDDVSEDKTDTEKLGISSGSLIEIKGQEEIGESVFTKMDSSIDDESTKMTHRVGEQVKDEENLSKAIEESQSPDSHALGFLARPSEPNDETYEESSKSVFEEQCHQTTNVGEKTEADVHKERTDSESLQIIEEKVEIPEIVAHSDDSHTVRVKGEDALEEDISNIPNSGELVEKATDNGVGDDHEYDNNITNSGDTIITDINKEKANINQLDIESDLGPEDHSQVMLVDKESFKVEEAPSLQNNIQSLTVNDPESGSRVEKNVKEMAYALKNDEILEHTSICKNIEEDVQKKEEPLNNFMEKYVSSERADCAEADSGRKMLDEAAKDAKSVVCKENQKFKDAIPTSTYSDQDNERKEVNDGIKSETATDEVEVSKIESAAQKSESSEEMKPDKIQLPDYGSQTLNANVEEDQTYTTRRNNNDRDILELIINENTKNKDDNTNKILDSSPITGGLADEAHRNLHGDWDGSTIKVDCSKDEIPNQENHSFITQYEEREAVDVNNEQGIANSNDNEKIPVFTAFDEETREEVQKKHEKPPESSYEDQIDEGHIKSFYIASLKEEDKIVELERDSFTISSEQNDNELIRTDVLQNDQMEANSSANRIATPMEGDDHCHDGMEVSEVMGNSLQDEAKLNDGNASGLSMQSQGMGGDEFNIASVEKIEKLESARKEENMMDQEAWDITANEQFQEAENESKKDKEPEANWKPEKTNSTPKDEVEIHDSKLAQIGLSEKTEKALPINDEDLIKSLRASSPVENAEQEIAEKFDKIYDYKPIECTEQAYDDNELGIELPKDKGSTTECPAQIEKFMHIAGDTASVPEIHVNNGKVPDAIPRVLSVSEPSGQDTVVKEDSVNPTEFSNLQSDEEDRKNSSLVEVTGSKEISHKISVMPDPELHRPEEEKERVQLEEDASCEAVEFNDLQNEKKQHAEGNYLPVSRLLMDRILREEQVEPDKACDVEAEDNNTLHDGGEQHDAGISKEIIDETSISRHSVGPDELQTTSEKFKSENKIHEKLDDPNGAKIQKEEILVSFSPEEATGKTSISEDNVGQEQLKISTFLVEENQTCTANEKTEIPAVKDEVKEKNGPHDSSPTMTMAEDVKDGTPSLTEISACGVENDSRESTLTEKASTENKMDIEDCINPTSVQNEKVQGIVLEKYPKEQTNKKNDEVLDRDVHLPLVLKTSHEDNLLEEGSREGKAILQDVQKRDKASYEVSEAQYPSNAESVGETKSLVHSKETLPNPKYDQNGKSSSNLKDDLHGQTSEIESEVKMVEIEDENHDEFTGNQVPHEKDKSRGKAYLSELQEVDQPNLAVKSTDQTLEVVKNLLDGKILAVHTDEQDAVGITEAQADEDNSEGEKDEYKPEESGHDARVVVEARDADLKPAHKKSHNILSGVGSKVKHSLSKVKKAIIGKSSHSKTSPAK